MEPAVKPAAPLQGTAAGHRAAGHHGLGAVRVGDGQPAAVKRSGISECAAGNFRPE